MLATEKYFSKYFKALLHPKSNENDFLRFSGSRVTTLTLMHDLNINLHT